MGADLTIANADGDLPLDVVDDEKAEAIIERAMETEGLLDKVYLNKSNLSSVNKSW